MEEEPESRGYEADHVVEALNPGVDDLSDILPYAQREDLVIVTKDYSDFSTLEPWDHQGLILIANHAHPPHCVADTIERLVNAYRSRTEFTGRIEYLDEWVR